MLKKLLRLIQQAIDKMLGYTSISKAIDINEVTISDDMSNAIQLWKQMYRDKSPWLDSEAGIYSLGLAKEICNSFQQQMLSELETKIIQPGMDDDVDEDKSNVDADITTRAQYLNNAYMKRLIKKLPQAVEKGLALGGMVIKPYVSNNELYFDFSFQGEFLPIAFDDDGNITDIAFYDQFIAGEYVYTKIERQTFSQTDHKIVIENKAFKAKLVSKDDNVEQDLGKEILLTDVDRWATISQEPVTVENVDKPLYGFFRVPVANNVDFDSPLGISLFSPAVGIIERVDNQFSRLDWEYEGGQLAIDVDPTAVTYSTNYYGTQLELDQCKNRLYRKLDLGTDETYNQWTPALRDNNYIQGLNTYKCIIEDIIGLARGTISDPNTDAKTATEIKLMKQRTYITITAMQEALESAILDTVYAMNAFVDLYGLFADGDYETRIDWNDSILTDTDTELEQKLTLEKEGILSKAEVRAWYTGESIATAQIAIDTMEEAQRQNQLNDLFGQLPEATLEGNDIDDTNSKNINQYYPLNQQSTK